MSKKTKIFKYFVSYHISSEAGLDLFGDGIVNMSEPLITVESFIFLRQLLTDIVGKKLWAESHVNNPRIIILNWIGLD
jgi:hypothetical protein